MEQVFFLDAQNTNTKGKSPGRNLPIVKRRKSHLKIQDMEKESSGDTDDDLNSRVCTQNYLQAKFNTAKKTKGKPNAQE